MARPWQSTYKAVIPRGVSPHDPAHIPLAAPGIAHATHNPGSWITHWARVDGARTALVFEHSGQTYTRSYAAFENDVAQLAQLLIHRGVAP